MWIPQSVFAFAVSPASIEIYGARNEVIERTVTVVNTSVAEQTYYLATIKFAAGKSSGAPEFIPYETDHSGLPEWISFPVETVMIPARTKVDVPFTVTIPSGVESGSYFAAITISTTPSEVVATNGASIEAKTAVLLFVTVSGETIEKLALLDFVTPDGPIQTLHDVSYAFRIQNQGNVVVKPTATVTVKDIFSRTILVKDVNTEEGRVLPGSTRTFSGELETIPDGFLETVFKQFDLFAVGPVTATLSVKNGTDEQSAQIEYWMIPWQLLISMAVDVLILILIWKGIVRLKRRLSTIRTGR